MYAISTLIRQAFYQDKSARKRYLQITGYTRTNSALNRLARIIDSGGVDQAMIRALLESGMSADQISSAMSATEIQKKREREATFKPWLKASFSLVPPAQRQLNVPAMFIGHMSCLKLSEGLSVSSWCDRLTEVKTLIRCHQKLFYSGDIRSARENYFGEVSGYQYSPSPKLIYNLSTSGTLLQ